LDRIKGQDAAVGVLGAALRGGRVPHALLFAGPAGVGKATSAFEVAKAILCRKGKAEPCETCPSCRRVESRTHSDLYILAPPRERASIVIDDVRALSASLYESPMEGMRKVAVIDPADALTEEAQNSLLKTLEEPPEDTTIILAAVNTDALLPTVRSRCRRVDFVRIPDDAVERFLVESGVGKDRAAQIARVADGSFGAALALADGALLAARREAIPAVLGARRGGEDALAEAIMAGAAPKGKRKLKDIREDALGIATILESVVVDCIRVKTGSGIRANTDLADEIKAFAGRRDFEALTALEKTVSDGIIMLGYFADVRLVVTGIVGAFSRFNAADETQIEVIQ